MAFLKTHMMRLMTAFALLLSFVAWAQTAHVGTYSGSYNAVADHVADRGYNASVYVDSATLHADGLSGLAHVGDSPILQQPQTLMPMVVAPKPPTPKPPVIAAPPAAVSSVLAPMVLAPYPGSVPSTSGQRKKLGRIGSFKTHGRSRPVFVTPRRVPVRATSAPAVSK